MKVVPASERKSSPNRYCWAEGAHADGGGGSSERRLRLGRAVLCDIRCVKTIVFLKKCAR